MKHTFFVGMLMLSATALAMGQQKDNQSTGTVKDCCVCNANAAAKPIVLSGPQISTDCDMALGHINQETNDTIIEASFYFLPSMKEGKNIECIGCVDTDIPAYVFLVPQGSKPCYNDVKAAADKFMEPFESAEKDEHSVLASAAKASKKQIEKTVGVCGIKKYNFNTGHYVVKYSGSLPKAPGFMVASAIKQHIEGKAKKFGYTKSTKVEDLRDMLEKGDAETIKFVSEQLSDKD